MVVVSAQRWRSVMPYFYFGPDIVGMASWRDWFSVLGFGEGEGREIEKREDRQGFAFWRKKKAGFVFIGFWKRFFLSLFFLFFWFQKRFFFWFFFFLNIVLMWKIVGVSEVSVIYIYIYIERERERLVEPTVKWEKEIRIYGTIRVPNNYL